MNDFTDNVSKEMCIRDSASFGKPGRSRWAMTAEGSYSPSGIVRA